jgi:hypothetical protein
MGMFPRAMVEVATKAATIETDTTGIEGAVEEKT